MLRRPYVWCIPTQCLLLATIPMWQPHTSHHGPSGRWEGLSIIWIEPRPKDVLSRESSRRQRVLDREQYESPYRSGAGTYKHCTWTSIRDSFLWNYRDQSGRGRLGAAEGWQVYFPLSQSRQVIGVLLRHCYVIWLHMRLGLFVLKQDLTPDYPGTHSVAQVTILLQFSQYWD